MSEVWVLLIYTDYPWRLEDVKVFADEKLASAVADLYESSGKYVHIYKREVIRSKV
jgi:hypothetical protein